jgi:hypothetical protein
MNSGQPTAYELNLDTSQENTMRRSKKVMTVTAAIITATSAGLFLYRLTPAAAQEMDAQTIKRLQEADKNKDGLISREEARDLPRLQRNFDAIDTNKDNRLSREELIAFRNKNRR